MVRRNKITTRIPHNRYIEVFESIDHIFAETVLIRQTIFVVRVVNATVYAATHMSAISVSEEDAKLHSDPAYSVKPP
jgi:hypothetical protein